MWLLVYLCGGCARVFRRGPQTLVRGVAFTLFSWLILGVIVYAWFVPPWTWHWRPPETFTVMVPIQYQTPPGVVIQEAVGDIAVTYEGPAQLEFDPIVLDIPGPGLSFHLIQDHQIRAATPVQRRSHRPMGVQVLAVPGDTPIVATSPPPERPPTRWRLRSTERLIVAGGAPVTLPHADGFGGSNYGSEDACEAALRQLALLRQAGLRAEAAQDPTVTIEIQERAQRWTFHRAERIMGRPHAQTIEAWCEAL